MAKVNQKSLENLKLGVRFTKGIIPHNKGTAKMVTKTCLLCGKEFTRKFKSDRPNNFCSIKCSTKNLHKKEIITKRANTWKGTIQKITKHKKGEDCNFWKGGITPINNKIRASFEYRLWRKSVFERDKYTCVFCKQVGGYLEADHIKPFSVFPELRFAIDNGRTLCRSCHKKTDTYGRKAIIKYKN